MLLAQAAAMMGINVDGNIAVTFENILPNQGRFRLGMAGRLVMAILDMVTAWALYVFLLPARDRLPLLAAWFRITSTIIWGLVIAHFYGVVQLLSNNGRFSVVGAPEIQTQVASLPGALCDTRDIPYGFFEMHPTLLGVVAFRSGFVPRVFGVILALGGISYVIDHAGVILFPGFGLETSPLFDWGELISMFWLLIWGGKSELPTSAGVGAKAVLQQSPC